MGQVEGLREIEPEVHALRDLVTVGEEEKETEAVLVGGEEGDVDGDEVWEGEPEPLGVELGHLEAGAVGEKVGRPSNEATGDIVGGGVITADAVAVPYIGEEEPLAVPARTLRLCVALTEGDEDTLREPVLQGDAELLCVILAAPEAVGDTLADPDPLALELPHPEALPLAVTDADLLLLVDFCGDAETAGEVDDETVPERHWVTVGVALMQPDGDRVSVPEAQLLRDRVSVTDEEGEGVAVVEVGGDFEEEGEVDWEGEPEPLGVTDGLAEGEEREVDVSAARALVIPDADCEKDVDAVAVAVPLMGEGEGEGVPPLTLFVPVGLLVDEGAMVLLTVPQAQAVPVPHPVPLTAKDRDTVGVANGLCEAEGEGEGLPLPLLLRDPLGEGDTEAKPDTVHKLAVAQAVADTPTLPDPPRVPVAFGALCEGVPVPANTLRLTVGLEVTVAASLRLRDPVPLLQALPPPL